MAYDDNAKRLITQVIGTVESDLNYGAINYYDPITVGICQWFGVRAASILCRMRDENPSKWSGVATSIANDLKTVASTSTWWNSRGLTTVEGESLRPVLEANRVIQENQTVADMEVYKVVAISNGMDPENNTKTVLFFFTMYHQGPVYAFEVLRAVGANATLDEIYAAALANPVLGQYSTRYTTAYEMIRDGENTTTPPVNPPTTEPAAVTVNWVSTAGHTLILHMGAKTLSCYPDGHGHWIPAAGSTTATPDPDPTPDPGGDGTPAPGGSWTHPLPGSTMTSPYGPREFDGVGSYHYGTDFGAKAGAVVTAPTALTITTAYEDGAGGSWSAGTYAKGHTDDGKYTINFYHMRAGSLNVRVGQKIPKGHKIGIQGDTGNAYGEHLHFEMYEGIQNDPWPPPYGVTINPEPILKANGVNF